jgi:hypothetical protein
MKKHTMLNGLFMFMTIILLSVVSSAQATTLHDTNETNDTNVSQGGGVLPIVEGNEDSNSTAVKSGSGALLTKAVTYTQYDGISAGTNTILYGYQKQGDAWLVTTMNVHGQGGQGGFSVDNNTRFTYNAAHLLTTMKNITTMTAGGSTNVTHSSAVFTYEGKRLKSQKDYAEGKIRSDMTVLEWEGEYAIKTKRKIYNPKTGALDDIKVTTKTIKNDRVAKAEVQSSKKGTQTITYDYANTTTNDPQYYTSYIPNIESAIELHGLVQSKLIEKPGGAKTESYVYEFNPKGLVSKKTIHTKSTHVKTWTTYEYSYGNY